MMLDQNGVRKLQDGVVTQKVDQFAVFFGLANSYYEVFPEYAAKIFPKKMLTGKLQMLQCSTEAQLVLISNTCDTQ